MSGVIGGDRLGSAEVTGEGSAEATGEGSAEVTGERSVEVTVWGQQR